MSTNQSNSEPPNNPTPSLENLNFFHDFILNRLGSQTTLSPFGQENTINAENTDVSNNTASSNVYMRFLEDILQLPPMGDNNLSTLLRDSLNETNPVKLVLSEEGVKEISLVEFDPETYPDFNCCSITLKEFVEGDMVSKLPCNHLFNNEAILKWLKEEKAECPICRFKLSSVEKKVEIPSLIPGFGPPRMPRGRGTHLRRLMAQRHQREEESELQEALLASLSDQYMPVD